MTVSPPSSPPPRHPSPLPVLPTAVVGSHPQPDWLIDRQRLAGIVPRTRRADLWRIEASLLEQAQDDATLLAMRAMEQAGVDIISDGEQRRTSYSNAFATALEGIDEANPAELAPRSGPPVKVPRVVGPVRHRGPVLARDAQVARAATNHTLKMTLPGPFTMGQQAQDEHYRDPEALAMDLAAAVNAEAHALVAAGADMIQLDEPWVRNDPVAARRYAVRAIDRALQGLTVPTVVHLCFGYAAVIAGNSKPAGYAFLAELAQCRADILSIEAAQPKLDLGILADLAPKRVMLGVIDLSTATPESADDVAARIRAALRHCPADRLIPAPDCGMKYLPRPLAAAKLTALAAGAALVRAEI